jgi:hypothetical protein
MSVLIVSLADIAALMYRGEHGGSIAGAILPNRKVLGSDDGHQELFEEAIERAEDRAGKQLVGTELFDAVAPFIGREPYGIRVVEDEEAREILSEAGIT